jgi:Cellulose-binding Sde182, nucleoside hydrolase-like domain/Cellulose-binding protein Sde0182, C-terminal domain
MQKRLLADVIGLVSALALAACGAVGQGSPAREPVDTRMPATFEKHRMVVLTDIEADPDDTQSLVRLLLYANEIDIEALVATTSIWKKENLRPDSIRATLSTYGKVYDTLSQHAPGYPTEAELQERVMEGQTGYGMARVGAGQATEGSDTIIRLLESKDERPLWISVWGGANTLAQALYDIRATKSEAESERLISKLRVYTISDQDDSGIWIRREFPEVFYIVSPGGYGRSTWIAIARTAPGFEEHASNQWLAENIQQDHGPLGAAYPDVVWGMEGDTPAYLSLIPNGLNAPDHPDWGGWGGRYELYTPSADEIGVGPGKSVDGGVPLDPEPRPIWTNASDTYTPWGPKKEGRAIGPMDDTHEGNQITLLRWKSDFQRDFAARMDWTTSDYNKANHPPVVALAHERHLTAKSGAHITLNGFGTYDPDGDSLSYHWFNYAEAGTLDAPIDMGHAINDFDVYFQLPEVEQTETAHFVLKVTDKGAPPLTRYARVIVTITP